MPFKSGQVVEVRGEDSGEVEEEDEIDLPLTVLPPVERGSEPTPFDVVAGVLNQLAPVEGAGDSREIEALDCPASPPEPVGDEEIISPRLLEPSFAQAGEAGPSSPPLEQAIAQPPEPVFQTAPPVVSSPDSRIRFYERFVVKASQASPEARLSCDTHPFFNDIPHISQDQKNFFDKVFSKVGDIFDRCVIEWEPMKELVLRGIFESVQALESFTFLGIPDGVLSLVARTVAKAERMKVRVDWLYTVIGNICLRRDRLVFSEREGRHRARLAALLEETTRVQQMLGEIQDAVSARVFLLF